jgi:hypothetical protein
MPWNRRNRRAGCIAHESHDRVRRSSSSMQAFESGGCRSVINHPADATIKFGREACLIHIKKGLHSVLRDTRSCAGTLTPILWIQRCS